jgi:asparagine synthase (glutamine-hydrolysing)
MVNLDGAPVEPAALKKMARAAGHRGPDGIRYHTERAVGLAHLALNITPESAREHQPLVSERGDLVLVADVRIDNREELVRTLWGGGYLPDEPPTDAELILEAYRRWGEGCPAHLIGDFAFAIWDGRRGRLFAARDAMAMRALYYASSSPPSAPTSLGRSGTWSGVSMRASPSSHRLTLWWSTQADSAPGATGT